MRDALTLRASYILICAILGTAAAGAQTSGSGAAAASAVQASDASVYGPNEPNRTYKEGKILKARRVTTAPSIDGRLNDEVWSVAETGTGLTQRDPDNGKPMTDDSRIQVAYDNSYIYVAVTALDSQPALIAAGLARRDEAPPTDQITIGFDPRHDHQTAYAFTTNPSSWQSDFTFYDDQNRDMDYNAVWDVRAQVTEQGWIAEFRIPFSQMRFTAQPQPGQVWGFNLQRQIRRKNETGTWIAKPRGERGEVSFYGHLVFDEPLPSPSRLELVPYTLARTEHRHGFGAEAGAAVGLDLRTGLGTASTLSATFNPDFGQVEQDPAVLNLSVFETFFPEKRPFFLEDSRTFVPPYGLFQLFHSRRIGRAPGRLPLLAGDQVLERPDETTILGATKLTGKRSGWTYGALSAMTSREYADVEVLETITPEPGLTQVTGISRVRRLIEPAASYNVGRVQKDLGGNSNIGALVTGVLREQLDDAFTGGFDYNLRWDRNRQGWNGHWVVSHAPGPGGVKTSGGGITNYSVSRKHLNFSAHYDHFGRDLRINDIGFFRSRGNRNQVNGGFEVGNPDPWKKIRSIWGFTYWNNDWTDEKLLIGRYQESGFNIRFLNFWQIVGGGWRSFEIYDDLDTRGGPPIVRPGNIGAFYRVNSDPRKRWQVNFYGNRWKNDMGTTGGTWSPFFSYQPSDRLQTSVGINYNYGVDHAQWITNLDTTGDGVVDHVYGTLTRDVVDVTLRATYAFTRDLTVQTYLQPFVAVGDYEDTRRLLRPKAYDFESVTIPFNPDFNRKSLRGNIVMRWEYKPGSTLFAVWDLSQSDLSRPGEFDALRDLRSAFGADANHVFMIKANYWLNR
jgi:hypothetical protein